MESREFSDFIVFVDESGDHGMLAVDETYPIFVLCFCVFRKQDYIGEVIPGLTRLKFEAFGHDSVILHEHDIRKKSGAFSQLGQSAREEFLEKLTNLIDHVPFQIVAVAIRKDWLREKYPNPHNPYNLAMKYGLERVYWMMNDHGQQRAKTHFLFECRGKKEDAALELEFRRVCDGDNAMHCPFPFEIQMVDKKSNSPGLQLADMTARPVGMIVLRPNQPNRTREVLEKKFSLGSFFKGGKPQKWGFGLKVFPGTKPTTPG